MYRMRCEAVQEYDVTLSPGILQLDNDTLGDALNGRRALFVVDSAVDSLYGDALREYVSQRSLPAAIEVMSCSEADKTPEALLAVCSAAHRHELGRRDLLVALGGGVCCDLVSVAATLVRRGIPYLCLPTTLVAQVDAGVGLKGGVNFRGSKNYLGSFTPPQRVLVDPTFLRSVSAPELRAGFAEMLKVAILLDAALFQSIEKVGVSLIDTSFSSPAEAGEELIVRSCQLMLEQLSADCYETSLQRLVDFGHTFSGRLEEMSDFELRHGEAVAIDMALTCALAVELGYLTAADLDAVLRTLQALGLPTYSPLCTSENLTAAMNATMAHRDGALNLVVPTALGSATFISDVGDISASHLQSALTRLKTRNVRQLSLDKAIVVHA